MEVGGRITRSDRLRNGVATAGLLADRRSRPVVGANPREASNLREDIQLAGFGLGPVLCGSPRARDDGNDRRPRSTAFEVHFPAAANIKSTGNIAALGSNRRRGRGRRNNKSDQERTL